MRMRLKKHLEERIADCNSLLLAREGDGFFRLSEEEKKAHIIDLANVFGNANPVVLEIGCGKGAWAIQSAKLHPECNYLALEKLSNVIVVACELAMQQNLPNLKFINIRAENLDSFVAAKSVSQISLNFSCPFPKKTYSNRRLTSEYFLEIYKRILTDDGVICQKTDDIDFFEWSIESYREHGFEVNDIDYDLPADATDNVVTEYEAKFRTLGKKINALKAKPIK